MWTPRFARWARSACLIVSSAMNAKLSRASILAVALALCILACTRGRAQPASIQPEKESLREELARLQHSIGLSLAFVGETRDSPESSSDPVVVVEFAARSTYRWKNAFHVPSSASVSGGALTTDGNAAALDFTFPGGTSFGISHHGGLGFQEFKEARPSWPYFVCWSHDNSSLATITNDGLEILNLSSRLIQKIDAAATRLTSQCWSPDDKLLVYEATNDILVYNFEER